MAAPTKLISTSIGFQDAKGNVVASGLLSLTLSQAAEVTASGGLVTTDPLYFPLDVNGKITSSAIWFNDELTPSGTTYHAVLYASNGMRIIADFGQWSIAGASADLSTMVPVATNVSAANAVLLSPSTSQTVSQPSGTNLFVNRFEQRRYADQFSGADMGAKINAAIADLPSTGGIVDATAFQGAQSAAATITVTQGITVLLGGVTLTLAGSPGINLSGQGACVEGIGIGTTILQTSSGTADIIQTNNNFNSAKFLSLVSSVARTGGAALRCKGGNGTFEELTIDKTYNGISIIDSLSGATANNKFINITIGFGLASSGSWHTGILLGSVASGTVTSEVFHNVNISVSAAFSGFMVDLDSGCDTIDFENCEFVQVGIADAQCLMMHNTSTSNDPQAIRFTDCVFEAGTTKEAIQINKGNLVNFEGCQFATSKVAYDIGGGTAISIRDNKIVGIQNEALILSAGTNIRMSGCRIADTSLAANGGSNTIAVSANVTDFAIEGNDFTTVLSSANQPFQNILVNAGTSDRYWIVGNKFANFTSAGLNDGGTGLNKLVGFNSPFSAGSSKLYGTTLNQASSLNAVTLLNSQDAAAAITGNAADQTFYTFTIPAATLAAGKGIRVSTFWIHGTGTASITYKLFFGATAVINAASAVTGNGCMEAVIMNQPGSTTAQRGSGKLTPTGTASVVFSGNAPAENTANAIVVKATFNVANTDQITPAQWVVELIQ